MSRKSLKIITVVAAIILVVILIVCITAVAIIEGSRNVTIENEKITEENHISVDQKQSNTIKVQYTTEGTKDGQTKETGTSLDF